MRKRTAVKFDTTLAIREAWDFLWAQNLAARERERETDEKLGRRSRWYARTFYLTAADVESQVRAWAEDSASGRPWNRDRVAYGGYGFAVRFRGDLQSMVRDFLLRGNGGRIVGHNFGRGHVSGMRFRPAGEPMAEAEVETVARKKARRERPTLRHFVVEYSGRLLCVSTKRSSWRSRRRGVWTTTREGDVTCPRCLRRIGEKIACDRVA